MRSNPFKSLALMFLMITGASSVFGQTTNIIDWNTQWKYSAGGVLPAANWMATNYNDASWPMGAGVLGFPDNEGLLIGGVAVNTVLQANNTNGTYIFTYYFRTRFVLATTNNVTLMASNLLDDGAVIYLNGREVARPGMAAGAVAYTTQATRSGEITDATHGVDFYSIPITNAVAGTNVVAVEVHQNGTASSDMIMGMRIVADIPNPPNITVQPQDTTADAGQTAQFTVTATGTAPLTYRWYTNNILVPGVNSATYTTPATALSMDGMRVFVTVSNRYGIKTSTTNTLSVVQDVNGPVMISALALTTNAFEIRFNETITQASAANTNNYIVRILGTTNSLVVTQAQWGINRSSLRMNGTFGPGTNYVVCIYNIVDQRGNITSGDCMGITGLAQTNQLLSFGQLWRYNDNATLVGPPPPNWMTTNYSDNPLTNFAWTEGTAPLRQDQIFGGSSCDASPGTTISLAPVTHYFRIMLTAPENYGTNVSIILRHAVDDGAVFYLNGTEFHRFNMPAGPVTYDTIALSSREATCTTETIPIAPGLLRVGQNLLAVEVHQVPEGEQDDVWFDAQLTVSYRLTPTIPALTIRQVRTPSVTNVLVEYVPTPGVTWQLQHATSPSGATWQPLSTILVQGTNRYQTPVPSQGPRRFYRLKNP